MVLCLVVSDVYQLSICLFISKSHSIDLQFYIIVRSNRDLIMDLHDDYEENFVFDSVVNIYILFRFMFRSTIMSVFFCCDLYVLSLYNKMQ